MAAATATAEGGEEDEEERFKYAGEGKYNYDDLIGDSY